MPEDVSEEPDALLSKFNQSITTSKNLRSLDKKGKVKSKTKNADDEDDDRPPFEPG